MQTTTTTTTARCTDLGRFGDPREAARIVSEEGKKEQQVGNKNRAERTTNELKLWCEAADFTHDEVRRGARGFAPFKTAIRVLKTRFITFRLIIIEYRASPWSLTQTENLASTGPSTLVVLYVIYLQMVVNTFQGQMQL
ncbi:unnamed protein product [Soboliphyme baturini]|uniref:DUF3606 domain-containing protein n=1 Tax=Soboliphyme baturini TaxID=241478 RepID=A0A183IP28_9BILA|nr:unnamed protein product [Soboliphyme baturini]